MSRGPAKNVISSNVRLVRIFADFWAKLFAEK
jgi:hypothetical protein